MVDSVSVRFKNALVEKMLLNIRIQWNAGTACVSECVLKTLACRGLRVGPSKIPPCRLSSSWVAFLTFSSISVFCQPLQQDCGRILNCSRVSRFTRLLCEQVPSDAGGVCLQIARADIVATHNLYCMSSAMGRIQTFFMLELATFSSSSHAAM